MAETVSVKVEIEVEQLDSNYDIDGVYIKQEQGSERDSTEEIDTNFCTEFDGPNKTQASKRLPSVPGLLEVKQLDSNSAFVGVYIKQEQSSERDSNEEIDTSLCTETEDFNETQASAEQLPSDEVDLPVPPLLDFDEVASNGVPSKNASNPRNQKRPEFTCSTCGKQFSQRNHLMTHIMAHKGIKPYACDMCHRRFANTGNLNAHRLTHTGDRPFVCTYCNKGFSRNSNLKVHLNTHTGERPYVCQICSKAFSDNSTLKRHTVSHNGTRSYPCTICGKAFILRGALNTHLRTHTGEKPYKCKICLKGFSDGSVLRKHERIHSGEKPYRCSVCFKGFSQSFNMRRHVLTHGNSKMSQVKVETYDVAVEMTDPESESS